MFALLLVQHICESFNNLTLAQMTKNLSHATTGPLVAFAYSWTICYIKALLKCEIRKISYIWIVICSTALKKTICTWIQKICKHNYHYTLWKMHKFSYTEADWCWASKFRMSHLPTENTHYRFSWNRTRIGIMSPSITVCTFLAAIGIFSSWSGNNVIIWYKPTAGIIWKNNLQE